MKYIEAAENEYDLPLVELTRRNLEVLLAKLDDSLSKRTIIDCDHRIAVRAVENDEHYAHRQPGVMVLPQTGKVI